MDPAATEYSRKSVLVILKRWDKNIAGEACSHKKSPLGRYVYRKFFSRMDLQQINIKVFATEDSKINYTNFIKVFNRWMEEADSEDYLNYADYSHVDAGPGVLLILKQANYSIDNAYHKHGFLYNRKHAVEGDNADRIRQALTEVLSKCEQLEAAAELENAVHFNGADLLFMINNRHIAPNTSEIEESVQAELTPVLQQMYGGDDFTVERTSEDARERFALRISANSDKPISELLSNLGG